MFVTKNLFSLSVWSLPYKENIAILDRYSTHTPGDQYKYRVKYEFFFFLITVQTQRVIQYLKNM